MSNTLLIIITSIVGLLILVTILLPVIAKSLINRKLKNHATLHGTVGNIQLSLFTGKVMVQKIRITKTDVPSGVDTITVCIKNVIIRLKISALLRKIVIVKVILVEPELIYATVLKEPEAPTKKSSDKQQLNMLVASPVKRALEKILPFQADLEIQSGAVRYIDHTAKPNHDIRLDALNLTLRNLSNQSIAPLPASLNATGTLFGGRVMMDLKLEPMEEYLTFDTNVELIGARATELNDYFRAYANIDVNAGTLSVYTELVAKDGGFKGYVKPVLKDIDVIGAEDKNDSILKKIWERVVAVAIQGLENNKVDQIATKIEVEGRFDDPHINIFAAIGGVFKNAFIQALRPSLENALGFGSIFKSALSGTASLLKKILLN